MDDDDASNAESDSDLYFDLASRDLLHAHVDNMLKQIDDGQSDAKQRFAPDLHPRLTEWLAITCGLTPSYVNKYYNEYVRSRYKGVIDTYLMDLPESHPFQYDLKGDEFLYYFFKDALINVKIVKHAPKLHDGLVRWLSEQSELCYEQVFLYYRNFVRKYGDDEIRKNGKRAVTIMDSCYLCLDFEAADRTLQQMQNPRRNIKNKKVKKVKKVKVKK